MWTVDLKNAYFHVSVHWRHVKCLGFRWRDVYYCFVVLPFGLKTSAAAFSRVAAVPARRMRELDLVSALLHYMGDYVGSVGRELDYTREVTAVRLLIDMGFLANAEKVELRLSRVRQALGFVLDTQQMCITITEKRRLRMHAAAACCVQSATAVSARDVARVVGHAISASLVYGVWARALSSYLLLWVARAVARAGSDGRARLAGRALEATVRWERASAVTASQPMHRHARAANWTLECDASETKVACIVTMCPEDSTAWRGARIRRELSGAERKGSSTLRELTGYAHGVRTLAHHGALKPGVLVEIVGDSRCAAAIFLKGGSQAAYDEDSDCLPLL
jgi:hypothetical protein